VATDPVLYQAEQAILGAMMLDSGTAGRMAEVLKPDDFNELHHGRIFETVCRRVFSQEPIDPVSMADALRKEGLLQKLTGGAAYLHELVASVPLVASSQHYADMLLEAAIKRRLWKVSRRIEHDSSNLELTADDAISRAVGYIEGLRFVGGHPAVDGQVLMQRVQERWANPLAAGWSTGLSDLDKMIKGLQRGRLYCVAGRPGMGKSILLTDIARATALRQGIATQIYELEMSDEELGCRLLAAESGVSLDLTTSPNIGEQGWARITAATERIAAAPIEIYDSTELSMTMLEAHVHNRVRTHGVGVVILDYLQLVEPDRSIQQRQEQVSAMSRRLKLLARREDVAVVFAAQLNRGPEARTDKRPQLSDLRESGSLEQDADVVILVHRPDHYDAADRPGEADLIVAKNRSGQTGVVEVAAQLWLTRFVNLN
jgi:replicative DNA helicase